LVIVVVEFELQVDLTERDKFEKLHTFAKKKQDHLDLTLK
jgi:hypothetical protein